VTIERSATENAYIARAVEVSINVGLVALLAAACLLILVPFVPIIAWGIIIAVASYPALRRLQSALQGRGGWAAAIWTVLLLAVLIVPVVLLAKSTVGGARSLTEHMNEGTFIVPPPPPNIESWPLIGAPLNRIWSMASNNFTEALKMLAPQLKTILPGLLSASAGIGLTVLQFFFSILISGALLAKAQSAAAVTRAFANRLFGERGAEFQNLVGSTIRSVTSGILGVALIQTVLAAGGFLVVGLPGAGLCDLSRGSCPADRAAGTYSRSHFRLCDRDYHQGRDLPDLVYRRWSLGQRTEAPAAGPWGLGSNCRGLPRCHRWIRRDGDHRPVRRRNRIVSGLQTVSGLGRAQRRRINQYRGRAVRQRPVTPFFVAAFDSVDGHAETLTLRICRRYRSATVGSERGNATLARQVVADKGDFADFLKLLSLASSSPEEGERSSTPQHARIGRYSGCHIASCTC
jgi:hypothetical protein